MNDYIFQYSANSAASLMDMLIKGLLGFGLLLLYVLFSWLLVKLISYILKKTLRFLRIQKLQDLLDKNEFLNKFKLEINLNTIIITFVRAFTVLLLVVVGAELFGLEIISQVVSNLMSYLPKLFVALAILVVGIYFASWIRNTIVGFLKAIDFSGARFVGSILFYIVLVFVAVTALNQAGINTDIITSNISIIIGAMMLVIVLALGLGAKDIVARLLNSFYTRKNIEIGNKIRINNELEGFVIAIDNVYLCLLVDGKKNFIPINTISESTIEVLE